MPSRKVEGSGSGGTVDGIITTQVPDDNTLQAALKSLVDAITVPAGYMLDASMEIQRKQDNTIDIIHIWIRNKFTNLPVSQGG